MELLFVIVACVSLICAVTAVLQVRQIGWAVWLWFFSGWVTGELAVWLIGSQMVFVALCVLLIGTGAPGFAFGLSCFLAAWGLLAWALRDGFDAGTAFHRALRVALGADFLNHIPEAQRAKLTQQIHSQEWLWPFRFRRPGVRYVRNVSYSTAGKRGLLDIYTPVTQGARRPVLLHVHGGAWMMGHKSHQGQPLLHRMVELGWVGVSINYRLAPRDAYPAQIIDVKKAIAWVKTHIEEYGGDPEFIVVTGGSAGGISLSSQASPPVMPTGRQVLRARIRRCRVCWQCIRLWISPTGTAFGSRPVWMDSSAKRSSSRPERRHHRYSRMARLPPGSTVKASPRRPPRFVLFRGPMTRWFGLRRCGASLPNWRRSPACRSSTQSCRVRSTRLRFFIHPAPVIS